METATYRGRFASDGHSVKGTFGPVGRAHTSSTEDEMPATDTTTIVTPSTDEIETAWFNLMQGELGIDDDWHTRDFVQSMLDHLRSEAKRGAPIMDAEGEPLSVVTSAETARRIAAAYAVLFYG